MSARSPISKRRKRLGRGLGSLISAPAEVKTAALSEEILPDQVIEEAISSEESQGWDPHDPVEDVIHHIQLIDIKPNRGQPRQDFDDAAIAELAESIRTAGVMQPVIVRPHENGSYELIAGERRLRAAKQVMLETIPAIVRTLDDQTASIWALIENLQREDLNPVERADAFRILIDEHQLTHQELADQLGVDRSTISNLLRINDLDSHTKDDVRHDRISLGHAKVLSGISDVDARRIFGLSTVREGWSVRELERRITASKLVSATTRGGSPEISTGDHHLKDLEQKLGEHFGTRVKIQTGRKKGAGKLIIEFFNLDEFDGLMKRIGFEEKA